MMKRGDFDRCTSKSVLGSGVFSRKLLIIGLIFLIIVLSGCDRYDLNSFPIIDCANPTLYSETAIMTNNSWLCLKGDISREMCVVNSDNGEIRDSEYIEDMILSDESKLGFKVFLNAIMADDIDMDETTQVLEFLNELFLPSSEACTTKYGIPVNNFLNENGGVFKETRVTKLSGHLGGVESSFPLMLDCRGLAGSYVIQDSTEWFLTENEDNITKKHLFYCTSAGIWTKAEDFLDDDLDGAPNIFDCDDENPSIYPDLSVFKSFDEIEPSQEICNDGKDNVCHGDDFYNWPYFEREGYHESIFLEKKEPWSPEIDDCDNNKFACENNCLVSQGTCDYLTDETQNSQNEGFCCGAQGIDGLGNIKDNPDGTGDNICLPIGDENIVSYSGEFNFGDCSSEEIGWCWVDPQIDNPFNVMTVKVLGENSYDIISNGADWNTCNESNYGKKASPIEDVLSDVEDFATFYNDNVVSANRFLCHKQGEVYAWAECLNEEIEEISIKQRVAGDGELSFYVGGESDQIKTANFNKYSTGVDNYYKQDTELEYTLDFTGYTHLEFFVELIDFELPFNVNMDINGISEIDSEPVIYFNEPILGYAINSPLLEVGNLIQIKVPINDWKDISSIKFSSTGNEFNINNLKLVNEDEPPKFCSGYTTNDPDIDSTSSWINDIDFSSNSASGDKICASLYGPDAWLGLFDQEVSSFGASCCGDDLNEYYAGPSRIYDDEIQRGCWNGEVIKLGDTINNVQYEVTFAKEEKQIIYPPQELDFSFLINDGLQPKNTGFYVDCFNDNEISYLESPKTLCTFAFEKSSFLPNLNSELILEIQEESEDVEIYFFMPDIQENKGLSFTLTHDDKLAEIFKVQIIAETQKIEQINFGFFQDTKIINSTCKENTECHFALPGVPAQFGYTIKNPHPELYELYFVTQDETTNSIIEIIVPVEGLTTDPYIEGNLLVKKLSQQVVYSSKETEFETDYGFYGCNAADYVLNSVPSITNLDSCSVQAEYFCSPQGSQDNFFTMNTWSTKELEFVGYDIDGVQEAIENEETNYPLANCEIFDYGCSAEDRTNLSFAPIGRNIIYNAEFLGGNDIEGWELRHNDHSFVGDENDYVQEGVFSFDDGMYLTSEKIALENDAQYYFDFEADCEVKLLLYEEGEEPSEITENGEFKSELKDYALIKIEKGCTFSSPEIRKMDSRDVGIDVYNSKDYNDEITYERTSQSCCPEGMCWNGYACASDMSEHTFLTEVVGEANYRCVQGDWVFLEPKYDWNKLNSGFCSNDDQCFITSSLNEGVSSDYNRSDFYEGNVTTCINSGEYVLDHQCLNGNWSSRTKEIAQELLESIGNDDFSLVCDSFDNVFIDYVNNVNYLGGELSSDIFSSAYSCYPGLETVDVVSSRENTCINNVCLLVQKDSDGNNIKTSFATTMDKAIDDPQSFLISLGVSAEDLASCTTETGFSECSSNLWYSQELGAIVYSKDGIDLSEPGFIDTILGWFFNRADNSLDFVERSIDFNKLFLLDIGGKSVMATQESNGEEQLITAEYENFESPVCEFVNNIRENKRTFGQYPDIPLEKVQCSANDNQIFQVTVEADLLDQNQIPVNSEFWWPALTGKLRVE
jgi:hypothetical protein